MMDRLDNQSKIKAAEPASELKEANQFVDWFLGSWLGGGACERAQGDHEAALREAPGRHHHGRLLVGHDGGLGQQRREPAPVARGDGGDGLREDSGGRRAHPGAG